VLLGEAYGARSPVSVHSPLFYVDVALSAGATLPLTDAYPERALYLVEGALRLPGREVDEPQMLVFAEGAQVTLEATAAARVLLLGGEPLDGERFMFWNFVSSSKERLEQAKADWKEGRFPAVPGDAEEFVPLPER
jgi:redox-sensitive bicupin YhaK (pirin superfamily)